MPAGILYDGNNQQVIRTLTLLFKNRLTVLDEKQLSSTELSRINNTTSEYIHDILNKVNADYLFCFGKRILKKTLINAYPNRLINFHPALLPAFKGLVAIDQALSTRVSFLGNTAHFINERIDSGKIIIQSCMYRDEFEDYEDVLELQFPMLKIILRDLLNYQISDDELFSELQQRSKFYFMPNKVMI